MSLSKEYQEFHLTPSGWVEGSFKADTLGTDINKEIPDDRVLTTKCYDELTDPRNKPYFYDKIAWETRDKEALTNLKKKYGHKPKWFGYHKE